MYILWLKYRKLFKGQIDGFNEIADTEGWGEKGHKKNPKVTKFSTWHLKKPDLYWEQGGKNSLINICPQKVEKTQW